MSVLIKGMEMPKSCLECRLYNDPWCMAKNRNQWRTAYNRPPKGERQNDCPLVEVPTPHGRLIDANALQLEAYNMMFREHANDRDVAFVNFNLEKAPTIIESEAGDQ